MSANRRGRGHGRLVVLAAFVCTVGLPRVSVGQGQNFREMQRLVQVFNQVRVNYVDAVPYPDMVRAAINGLLRSLDPHSRYLTRAQATRFDRIMEGGIAGIGVTLEDVAGRVVVLSVDDRGPADRKGVRAGDRIVAVADSSIAGFNSVDVTVMLAGAEDSRVRVTLERGPAHAVERRRVEIKRKFPETTTVGEPQLIQDSIGYVRLREFDLESAEDLEDAIRHIGGDHLSALILDLRHNPGGVLRAAVDIASLFYPEETLVFSEVGRKVDMNEEFRTERNGRFRDVPLVVLVDEASASASEALAGSLQDHSRAVIVGRNSFGKGLIQVGLPVDGGILWLTTGRVVLPSGRKVQRDYHNLTYEQYLEGMGSSTHTGAAFTTDAGDTVWGGGGITPEIEGPALTIPPWWDRIVAGGWDLAIADSVARNSPDDDDSRDLWLNLDSAMTNSLARSLSAVVQDSLGIDVEDDPFLPAALRVLVARVIEVNWGVERRDRFLLDTDPLIARAVSAGVPRAVTMINRP